MENLPALCTILLISTPGLRKTNMLAILLSVPGSPEVLCADSVEAAQELLAAKKPDLAIIDRTLGADQIRQTIQVIRKTNSKTRILLLVSHPHFALAFEDARPDAIMCDGFSSTQVIREIQKARLAIGQY